MARRSGKDLGEVKVPIRADTEKLPGDLKKARALFEGTVQGLGKLTTAVFGALTLDRLVQASLRGLRAIIDEMAEAERAMLQTEARLRATGGASGTTAAAVAQLADELSRLTGASAPAIQSAQTLLITFQNIRNEVGEGNNILDRATKAALDMAVAFGGGPEGMAGAARQLGVALNDPIRGMSLLQRMGVSFTAAQKEQIQALAETGRLLEAQKLLLAEVEKAVGGAADAYGQTWTASVNMAKDAILGFYAALGEQSGTFDRLKAGLRGMADEFRNLTETVHTRGIGRALQRMGLTVLGTAMDFLGLDATALADIAGRMDLEKEALLAPERARIRAEKEEAERRATLLRAEEERQRIRLEKAKQTAEALKKIEEEAAKFRIERGQAEAEAEYAYLIQQAEQAAAKRKELEEKAAAEAADEIVREGRRAMTALTIMMQGQPTLAERLFGGRDAETVMTGFATFTHSLAAFMSQLRGGGGASQALSNLASLAGNLPALLRQAKGSAIGGAMAGVAFGQTASTITGGPGGGGAAGAVGSALGTGLGAALGSVLPGVGTAIGAVVGGGLGGALGGLFGKNKRFELPPEFQQTLESVATLSREGVVNLTDLAKTYEDQLRRIRSASQLEGGRAAKAFLDQFVKIAGRLSSAVTGALGSGISDFLLGRQGDLLGALRTGIQEAVVSGITESLIQSAMVKGALGDLLGQISEQLARREDTSATIAAIGQAVPGLVNSLLGVLQPLRQNLADAFSGRAPGLGNVDRSLPLLDEGGLVTRSGLAVVHKAEVVGLPQQLAGLAGAAMPGPVTILVETDGRITARKVLEHLPRELRLKGIPL